MICMLLRSSLLRNLEGSIKRYSNYHCPENSEILMFEAAINNKKKYSNLNTMMKRLIIQEK